MELKYKNLDRLHRARLVGQYHVRKGFDDLRAYGDWYNQLNAEERVFVNFYRNLGHDGALDPADIRHLPLGECIKVKLKFDVDPKATTALNDALARAAVAMAGSVQAISGSEFNGAFRVSGSLIGLPVADDIVKILWPERRAGNSIRAKEAKK